MTPRTFTPEEANAALPDVRPLAEEMAVAHRALAAAERRRAALAVKIAGDGGDLDPGELGALAAAVEQEAAAVERCVEAIQALGCLVKDTERGLVDFPALRGGEQVLLCWQLGEDEVAWWHGLEDGFAGRRPLPF